MRPRARLATGSTVLLLAAAAAGDRASATHDPTHPFSGNWATTVQTPAGARTGTISFRAVTAAEGEAAMQAMGVLRNTRPQYCWANNPGQYYVGAYNGGIGEGYELSSSHVPAPPDGTHAGCVEAGFYKGWFKPANADFGLGQVRIQVAGSQIYDSFWHYGDFGGTDYAIAGTFTGHFAGDGAESDADTDGDGLRDSWETKGYDANDDGTVDVKLPAMGADPRHKDVFVQLDQMLGHTVDREAVKMVVDALGSAPVANPDGRTGITLHVDQGPGTVMNPRTGATWGSLSHAGATKDRPVLGSELLGRYSWSAFDAVKKQNFPAARSRIFHYVISVDRWGSASEGATGLSRGAPSSDFIVSLGATCPKNVECRGTTQEQAGTLMHELGHNLGLDHGGDSPVNFKPNYLSIMNYAFQLTGLQANGKFGVLDYSRYGPSFLAPLDENALGEGDGFGRSAATLTTLASAYYCPNDTAGEDAAKPVSVNGPVDWNCNNKFDKGTVDGDVNGDGKLGTLTAYDDWSHLVYTGGGIGGKGAAPQLPSQTSGNEAPAAKLVAAARGLLGDKKPPTATITGPRVVHRPKKGLVVVRVHDDKALAQLIFVVDKKTYQFDAAGKKTLTASVKLVYLGRRTLKGAAIDRAGNVSKTVVLHVRVLPR